MYVLALLAVLAPLPLAQTSVPLRSDRCEIHIWPAEALHSLTEGAVWNNALDSAFTVRPGHAPERQAAAHGALDPEGQLELLAGLDLPTLLHAPGALTVTHASPSARRATGSATGRQAGSTSPCYMEVTIVKNFYNRSGLTDRTLRTLFVLDDYRDQAQPVRSFVAWGTTPLQIFPAKLPEQAAAADAELAEAFRRNMRQFSGYAFAPPRKK